VSIKSQLHSSRDFLMVGMRRAARGAAPNAQAERLLRACLDLVEQLARQPEIVTVDEVEKTLAVLHQAAVDSTGDGAAADPSNRDLGEVGAGLPRLTLCGPVNYDKRLR
jgi:hypothetical protein